MTEIFLGIIAFAALVGCMGLMMMGFVSFHMAFGYKEWISQFTEYYMDEVFPKQMKKMTDNLFKEDFEDEEPEEDAQ